MNTKFRHFSTQSLAILATMFCVIEFSDAIAQAMPSAEQVQQFKNLPAAQQKQMAESLGIDLGNLGLKQDSGQPNLSDSPTLTEQDQIENGVDQQSDDDETPDEEDNANKKRSNDGGDELRLFGQDLFNSAQKFQPAIDIPIPSDYVLGPGDTLVVQLYGKENSSNALVINREGQIQFPQIGPVTFAGLTFTQAQELVAGIVSEQMIGIKASVTMGALRTIRVFVLGEVAQPGSFVVGSLASITNALFSSGGVTDVGSLRNIQLKRQGKIVSTLDLYDLLLRGDTSNDKRLLPGDVIFVPPVGKLVSINGEVKRPAKYELKQKASIADLIELAGGLTNNSFLPISYLVRHDNYGENELINVDLSSRKGMTFSLQDGDYLSIASKLDFVNNQVVLSGHIKRPGPRSWAPDQHFTSLIPNAFHLLPNPDIDIALIQRFSVLTRRVETILFSPTKAWKNPGSKDDPLLQSYDVIQIFNYDDQRDEQLADVVAQLEAQARFKERKKVVNITGSVRFPGRYPLSDGMTTEELIELAGGLTESALDTNGEITRYQIDENRQRLVLHIDVDFKSDSVALEPGDTLQVKQIPLWKNRETVEISGEVMFPGTYTILPGETLMDVLARAGGLTPQAYPLGAIFSRQQLRDLEQQRITELRNKLQSDLAAEGAAGDTTGKEQLDPDEAEQLLKNLNNLRPLGRMVIDLPDILKHPGKSDFQMEDGDSLVIPRFKPSVTVVGEVQYPTSHFYDEALDTMEYVERSGGFKKQADDGRVYIVKANGSVMQPNTSAWFRADARVIEPGDTIVVPLETDRVDNLTVWAKATQIIYQAALGAAAINGL